MKKGLSLCDSVPGRSAGGTPQGPALSDTTKRTSARKSPNVQSFGIKFERIDRDLLWVYVTAVGRLYI